MEKELSALALRVEGAKLTGDARIRAIEHDSRKVKEGTLFVAIKGQHVDGHDFIPAAIEKGAVAVLTEEAIEPPKAGIAVLQVPNLDKALEEIVPFFHDYPARSMRVLGITGTNGKTTTSYMTRAILRAAGYKVGLIGTIQVLVEEERLPAHNTTPDIVELQETLAYMRDKGMDYVVMEVSSHALALNRIAGIEFDAAAFTNLTQDHLDFHKTLANYREAKAKLFTLVGQAGSKKGKAAVVNIDDAAGNYMLSKLASRSDCQQITYSDKNGASLVAKNISVTAKGASFTLHGPFGDMTLALKVTGLFNVHNAMAAIGLAVAEKIDPQVIQQTMAKFKGVPGRFELVDEGQDFSVIVDYAHTPDGLENILKTARQITKRRILTVFGCGGDRDRTKRPIMGRIAAELSDIIIATSDNPRTEDPAAILDEVERGVREKLGDKRHEKIQNRREAIEHAIKLAETGDIIIIAGKGHEDYQILKDKTIHFDDREVAREALKARQKAWVMAYPSAEIAQAIDTPDEGSPVVFQKVSTDTREDLQGALFVALQGEHFNGADYLQEAEKKGAFGVVTDESTPREKLPHKAKVFAVKDTLYAYQEIAHAWREKFAMPVVAITGSNGKTTTKDLVAAVLSSRFHVQRTAKNLNNEIGLPKTLLGIRKAHGAAVVEIGMRGLGQIRRMAPLAHPNVGIVTNVGEAHMSYLGSKENIAQAKSELIEALEAGSYAILNADDQLVAKMQAKAKAGVQVLTFGIDQAADVKGSDLRMEAGEMRFAVTYQGKTESFAVGLLGKYNVYNALAAIATGYALELTTGEIREGLRLAEQDGMRFSKEKVGDFIFVNDAYNASPESMRAALGTLREMHKGRCLAVLGDMLELGEASEEAHRAVGLLTGDLNYSVVIAMGDESAGIAQGAEESGVKDVYRVTSHEEAAKVLHELLKPGDAVIFKGSRAMMMEKVIEIFKTSFTPKVNSSKLKTQEGC